MRQHARYVIASLILLSATNPVTSQDALPASDGKLKARAAAETIEIDSTISAGPHGDFAEILNSLKLQWFVLPRQATGGLDAATTSETPAEDGMPVREWHSVSIHKRQSGDPLFFATATEDQLDRLTKHIQDHATTNLLTRPILRTLDGVQSQIEVGSRRPLVAQATADGRSGQASESQFAHHGVSLSLLPTIIDASALRMRIDWTYTSVNDQSDSAVPATSDAARPHSTELVSDQVSTNLVIPTTHATLLARLVRSKDGSKELRLLTLRSFIVGQEAKATETPVEAPKPPLIRLPEFPVADRSSDTQITEVVALRHDRTGPLTELIAKMLTAAFPPESGVRILKHETGIIVRGEKNQLAIIRAVLARLEDIRLHDVESLSKQRSEAIRSNKGDAETDGVTVEILDPHTPLLRTTGDAKMRKKVEAVVRAIEEQRERDAEQNKDDRDPQHLNP